MRYTMILKVPYFLQVKVFKMILQAKDGYLRNQVVSSMV
jgi:hypothetical protein